MDTLFTPWRYAYISGEKASSGCFLCEASADPDEPERLVIGRTRHHIVLLNRFPYTNGHLMIAPREHIASPVLEGSEARDELWPTVLRAQAMLEDLYSPDGFNIGVNLGAAAGAGVPDHFHVHVVPRWGGDTNFMSAVGGVRVVPEDPVELRERLVPLFRRGEAS